MKLKSFSVSNYRSIIKLSSIKFNDITVLLGKNNEGKTNIIRAISVAMNVLDNYLGYNMYKKINMIDKFNFKMLRENRYDWDRDFPVLLQDIKTNKKTVFELKFELNSEEINELKKKIKKDIKSEVVIRIEIGIQIQNTRIKVLNTEENIQLTIIKFIKDKLSFNYIPAIRTEDYGINVIESIISNELSVLENNAEYKKGVEIINKLQNEILNDISNKTKETLEKFIPSIKDVKIEIMEDYRLNSLRNDIEVIIDDGNPTNIKYKGDGIKNLVSLGLLTERYNKNSSIIAIDEPEAHLHPGAIDELNKVIRKLRKDNQIIICTHNPRFVDKSDIGNNIIIDKGKAKQCKDINEIRDVLGIKYSDNLINSRYILMVEGENDEKSLYKILSSKSKKIKSALKNNELRIHSLNGASNLSANIAFFNDKICKCYILLDNDNEGKDAIEKARSAHIIEDNQYTLTACNGMRKSEFEDYFSLDLYKEYIKNNYGVDLENSNNKRIINGCGNKWSERMKRIFENNGKIWDDNVEKIIKNEISSTIALYPESKINNIFNINRISSLEILINSIENMISKE